MSRNLQALERYGGEVGGLGPREQRVILSSNGHLQVEEKQRFSSNVSVFKRMGIHGVKEFLVQVFLPQGYPNSVSGDYLNYQLWDTVQAFCSSLSGGFATRAVLKGAGVGDESASVLAATITWLLRDGTGLISRILFAWWKGQDLDFNNKQWRLFADVANDIATALNMASSVFGPAFFTPVLCLSSVSFAMVGVAGGATRVAVQQHQALRGNMADVSAKDSSQESVVNLTALVVSLILLPMVEENLSLTWLLFLLFTCIHLYANFRAVSCLRYTYFNRIRAQFCWETFLTKGKVPSIPEANVQEPILPIPSLLIGLTPSPQVFIGRSLSEIKGRVDPSVFENLNTSFKDKPFVIYPESSNCIHVCLRDNRGIIRVVDQLEALFIALSFSRDGGYLDKLKGIEAARLNVDRLLPCFLKEAESRGWEVERSQLGAGEFRLLSLCFDESFLENADEL